MRQEYLSYIKKLLNDSLNLCYYESSILHDIENNKFSINMSGATFEFNDKIALDILFAATIIFSAFDYFLEEKYDDFKIQPSYYRKYKALPFGNDIEKTQKNIYRIAKTLRNAFIHNSEDIKIENEIYKMHYEYNSTNYKLEIGVECLKELCKAIYVLIDENTELNKRGTIFKNGLAVYYNNYLISNVILEDEHGLIFYNCESIPLNSYRSTVINTEIEENNNCLIIKNSNLEYHQKRDFLFDYNGLYYNVPEEYLEENKIRISDLISWKLELS